MPTHSNQQPPTNVELKARAEMRLLGALNQHKARSASTYLREEQQRIEEEERAATEHIAKQDLRQYRLGQGKNPHPPTELEEMVASVRQLEHDVVSAKPEREGPGAGPTQIELNAVQRRERHMAAQQTYTDQVKAISEDIEVGIIQAADEIKETLEGIDQRIQRVHGALADDELLLRSENADVLAMWTTLQGICDERTLAITNFGQRLEEIELTRVERVGAGLKELTHVLMDTAHALPPEVERIIEAEAYELNIVVISNKKAYADLIARMATADVDVLVETRAKWERGQEHWRHLRHEDAIAKFQAVINSTQFTDPPERKRVCEEIREFQQTVHSERRMAVLDRLRAAGAELTSVIAEEILQELVDTQKREEEMHARFFAGLREVHEARVRDGKTLREALRLELHGFGALAPEGDIPTSMTTLATLLKDETLEEFFRMAGGLRAELDSVVRRLNLTELIYPSYLAPLRSTIDVLLSALPLDGVMESQGKGAERKAVQATLEKMRKAGKQEILGVLPTLQSQINVLMGLSDMSEVFKAEVEDVSLQLRALLEEADPTSSRVTTPTSPLDSTTESLNTPSSTTTPPSVSPSPPKSAGGGVETFMTSSATAPTVDLQAIRRVQRRLGTLVYATELSPAFQAHLRFIGEQLALQVHANDVVDAVIAEACEHLLAAREEEGKAFLADIGKRIDTQSARLHDQAERMAKFFLKVAQTVERSEDRVRYVNLSAMDLLDGLKDHDEEINAEHELAFRTSCARLRHAPDDAVLQDEFQRSSALLQTIEAAYRIYHKKVTVAAGHNVIALDKQRELFLCGLCELFGLVTPVQPGSFDVDAFLSVKHIDDLVDPPEVPPEEAASDHERHQQTAGESPEQHAQSGHSSVASTPRQQAAPKEKAEKTTTNSRAKGHKTEHKGEPVQPPKPRFVTASGLTLDYQIGLDELIHCVLTQKDADDEDDSADTTRTLPGDGSALVVDPSSHAPTDATQPGEGDHEEEDPAIRMAREAYEQQLRLVAEQVSSEFLVQEIPMSTKQLLVREYRDAVMCKFDLSFKAHAAMASETQEQRTNASNLLLEERLRKHWPRKGRLDVQCYQPRVGELYTHKQRQERQIRAMAQKISNQQQAFEKRVQTLEAHFEEIRIKQLAMQTQLPMQQSLAALQGLEVRSKKLLSTFKVESEEALIGLKAMTAGDLATISNSAQDFVKMCTAQRFPDLTSSDIIAGCDYHPDEIELVRQRMSDAESQLQEKLAAREAQVEELAGKQKEILVSLQEFKSRYQACLQSLSMREGLGQKYGLPRRSAQERYRSETTRSDEMSAHIDEHLASLQSIIETKQPVKRLRLPNQDIAIQVLHLLLRLRAKIFKRGQYFGFLKNKSQLEPLPVEFDAGGADGRQIFNDQGVVDEDDRCLATPFLEFAQQVASKCREETRQLYQQEGKLDELPASGVPAALEEYLTGQAEKARTYVIQQELKFREQVDFFGELLALAPTVALTDLLERTKMGVIVETRTLMDALDDQYSQWVEQRNKNMIDLRPDLCSPNNAVLLQALCQREAQRSDTSLSGLRSTRTRFLEVVSTYSKNFEKELLSLMKCFVIILDTSVMTLEDLKPFTGEELPKPKRKSLKRLRKLARIQEHGDPREIKRSDDEMKKLAHLGEAPRFAKRAWPAISEFGLDQLWENVRNSLVKDDGEMNSSPDPAISSVVIEKATAEDGSCSSLLTHAHRCLIHGRDETYTSFTQFCKAHGKKHFDILQERLRDEVKWTESWLLGIERVRQQQQGRR